MQEITDTEQVQVKRYIGNSPLLVINPKGKVLIRRLARGVNPLSTTFCPVNHTLVIGTEEEISVEAEKQDNIYAPIAKAELEAIRATIPARKNQ